MRRSAVLKQAGLRATAGRAAVWAQVCARKGAFSVNEVHRAMAGEGSGIGIATVYRAFADFERAGLLRRRPQRDSEAQYEVAAVAAAAQLICSQCGRTEELSGPEVERLCALLMQKSEFAGGDNSLYFYADCRRREACKK